MATDPINTAVEHLFRREAGKLAASVARVYGLSRLDSVEDIVQETLLAALSEWQFRGVPENPTAWAHRVARNKAIDRLRKARSQSETIVPLLPGLHEASVSVQFDTVMQPWEIEDSQLRMMFACCHPDLPMESQIALTLKTLCGFSVKEVASAFFEKESTIEKRLGRARAFFRDRHVTLEVPSAQALEARSAPVLHCLYLLFNEGYKRTDSDDLLRRNLCLEALRLGLLITEHPAVSSSAAHALVALMSFLAARFDARSNESGEIVLLPDQDRSKWNAELLERGFAHFALSDFDDNATTYHIEAAIQSLYVSAPTPEQTNWPAILGLYRRLYALRPSSIVALHMSVSLAEVHGPEAALELLSEHALPSYYLYHALRASALAKAGSLDAASESYETAIGLASNEKERRLLMKQGDALRSSPTTLSPTTVAIPAQDAHST